MNIVVILILFVLEASALGSPLKHNNERNIYRQKYQQFGNKIRIVGGVEVTPHSIPYQVALVIDNQSFCGGVLISTKYVLTVAHCTYRVETITVILGAHDIFCDEDTQIIVNDPTVINHENYSANVINDISLLKLNRNIPPTAAVRAIRFLAPTSTEDFVGSTGHVSGWGFTSTTGQIQDRLRKVNVEIIANRRCQFALRGAIPYSNICTSGTDPLIGPVGACSGDSGGPLVVGNELVGLVSYGESQCDSGYPTVYTRISYYRYWIAKHSGV